MDNTDVGSFIIALENMMIAQEGTLELFMDDPIHYIDYYQYNGGKVSRDDPERLGIINLDGEIYLQVMAAVREFVSVNMYASALGLMETFLERLTTIYNDKETPGDWKVLIENTVREVKDRILKVKEQRDTYESKRAAINGKYQSLLKKL